MTTVAEPKKDKKSKDFEEAATDGQEALALTPPKAGEPGFDWSTQYPGEKVFVYTDPNDVTVGLAAISKKRQPSIGFLRRTRKKPEFEQVLDMMEFIACDAALAIVDGWVPTDLVDLFEQWSEWNKTNAGE